MPTPLVGKTKGTGSCLRGHDAAFDRHAQYDIDSLARVFLACRRRLVDHEIRGEQSNGASAGQGVAGIQGLVQQGDLQLAGVGLRHPDISGEIDRHRDGLAQGLHQHVLHFRQRPGNFNCFGGQPLPPEKR